MNSKGEPFSAHHARYEAWFTRHQPAYCSELLAVRALLPWQGLGLEIGAGTGRFAGPLGIRVGLDPSGAMLTYAVSRGVSAVQGIAEALPFKAAAFDYALAVTTICFVDDPVAMLTEARRVLKPGGPLVIGFLDRASPLGELYLRRQAESVFYRDARFFSAPEIGKLLGDTGFKGPVWGQTLSKPSEETREIEPFREGYGRGGFVVVSATSR
jgi:SAM-dependent methyltransferase